MFARSTTVRGQTQSIDAGIANIRDEVMPTVLGIDGCVGMSLLVDRDSGRCIATTAWQSREAMRASDSRLRSIRDRRAGCSAAPAGRRVGDRRPAPRPHLAAGRLRPHTWVRMEPDEVDRAIDIYRMALLPRIEEFRGSAAPACWSTERPGARSGRRPSTAPRPWSAAASRPAGCGRRRRRKPGSRSSRSLSSSWRWPTSASPRWPDRPRTARQPAGSASSRTTLRDQLRRMIPQRRSRRDPGASSRTRGRRVAQALPRGTPGVTRRTPRGRSC